MYFAFCSPRIKGRMALVKRAAGEGKEGVSERLIK